MLNKCLNMFKSFTSMTTSGFFLFSPVIGHIKRRNRSFPISLYWHHVINLSQSQCVRVLTLTVSVTPANQVNRVGTRSDRSHPVCQSLTHSQSPGAAQETDWKGHFLLLEACDWMVLWFDSVTWCSREWGSDVECFFSSVFVLIVTFDYISTYIDWVINYDCTLTL